ncbi:MFS transporter [Corynebacterium sp. A21]|uniref:MFS transporter n=1 Tax=Corynebacterium sp. A21 TaxID=3457318 RepID=UPI003FD1C282
MKQRRSVVDTAPAARGRSGNSGLDQLSDRGRKILLYTCCMSVFIISMDTYAVNVALPSIGVDLAATVTQLQWVVSAYSLATAAFLMLAGSVADRIGRRRVFQCGLTLFALSSLISSFAPNAEILIAARVMQGIGGSMLNPVALSIITNSFTDPEKRARALGIWSATIGISMALGPPIGGLLVDLLSWRAVFWINVPIAVLAIILSARFIPESNAATHRRLDPPGQLLMILFLVGVNTGLIQGGALGWSHPLVLGCFVISALAVGLFLWWENHTPEPLLAPSFFRSRSFSAAVISALVAFTSTSGFLFVITLYLQQARGLTPMDAGLMLLPLALMMAVCAPISGRMVAAFGPAPPLMISGAVMSVAGLMFTMVELDTPLWYLAAAFAVYGIGFGIVNTPITNAAVSGLPKDQAGTAAAVTSTSRQVGNSLGAAIFGSLVVARLGSDIENFATAAGPVWWALAGMGVVIVLAGWSVRAVRLS